MESGHVGSQSQKGDPCSDARPQRAHDGDVHGDLHVPDLHGRQHHLTLPEHSGAVGDRIYHIEIKTAHIYEIR